MDYLTPLEADFRRLVEVAEGNLDARVPTCPEWSVNDLVDHVGMVYLHKVAAMRFNRPFEWPPPDLPAGETPLARLHRGYAELLAEFAARDAQSPAYTWHEPDQTVGFWIRRMAQETVIHRIDGELAAGSRSQPVSDVLALDGIDEVLKLFLAYGSVKWHDEFAEPLAAAGDGAVAVVSGSRHWLVTWDKNQVVAKDSDEPAAAQLSGAPEAMLRWLWRRADDGVAIAGDAALVAQMRQLLWLATQ